MTILKVRNPRSGEVDYEVPAASREEISAIGAKLAAAQPNWSSAGIEHRCKVLRQWRDVLASNPAGIAEALCTDTGRRAVSHYEVQGLINMIDRWADAAPQLLAPASKSNSVMTPSVEIEHRLVPFAVVGIISPWNFPLTLSMIDTIPALLAGSTVLLKPSEVTPRFIQPLLDSITKVEGLGDVLQIVTGGAETGIALIDNVDAICFTGSVPTGRKVGMQAAQNFIPAFLELGGKDPAIVLPSANIDNATTAILRSAAGMTGQACQSLERIYVHESIFDEFLTAITDKAKATHYNWPDINQGQIGPLIFADQAAKISEQMEQARNAGAVFHCGGEVEQHDGGCWIAPTVVTDVDHSMTIMSEETFGPIIPIMPFTSTDEAIALANDSQYGLSGAVFGADIEEAKAVAAQVNVGAVSINDAGLTAMVNDAEKNSFRLSGIGGSRMGATGLTRFLRKRALLNQTAPAIPLQVFSEGQS